MLRYVLVAALVTTTILSAETPPVPKSKAAAIVNGREIPEIAVRRGLRPVAPENRDKARADVVTFLVDNALVDHYLELLKVTVDAKEVETQLGVIKKEIVDSKQDYAKVLEKMDISEPEFKVEIHNQLRWEKFVTQQGTEDKLKKLFDSSPEIFDGSMVRARHILITPKPNDDAGKAVALKRIQEVKAGVDTAIISAIAKLPAGADNLTRQKQVNKAADDAFSAAARDHSVCPSKRDGGDLGEFPRMGMMVEQFAKAAFALKPFQVSEPVATPFGYHLIFVTAHKTGEPVKFDLVKGAVAEVYGAKLREAIVEKMKSDPNTKIEILK